MPEGVTSQSDITTSAAEASAGQQTEYSDVLEARFPDRRHGLSLLLVIAGVIFIVGAAFVGAHYIPAPACTYDQVEPCMAFYGDFAAGQAELGGLKLAIRRAVWAAQDFWYLRVNLTLPKGSSVEDLRSNFPQPAPGLYDLYRQQSVGIDPGAGDFEAGALSSLVATSAATDAEGTPTIRSSNGSSVLAAAAEETTGAEAVPVEASLQVAVPIAVVEQVSQSSDPPADTTGEQLAELSAPVGEVSPSAVDQSAAPETFTDGVHVVANAETAEDSVGPLSGLESELLPQAEVSDWGAIAAAAAAATPGLEGVENGETGPIQPQQQGIVGAEPQESWGLEVGGSWDPHSGMALEQHGVSVEGGEGSHGLKVEGSAQAPLSEQPAPSGEVEGSEEQALEQQQTEPSAEGAVEQERSWEGEAGAAFEHVSLPVVADDAVLEEVGNKEEEVASEGPVSTSSAAEPDSVSDLDAAAAGGSVALLQPDGVAAEIEAVTQADAAAVEQTSGDSLGAGSELPAATGAMEDIAQNQAVEFLQELRASDVEEGTSAAGDVATGPITGPEPAERQTIPLVSVPEPQAASERVESVGFVTSAPQQTSAAEGVQAVDTIETARAEPIVSAEVAEDLAALPETSSLEPAPAEGEVSAHSAEVEGASISAADAVTTEPPVVQADAEGADAELEPELDVTAQQVAAEEGTEPQPAASIRDVAEIEVVANSEADPVILEAAAEAAMPRQVRALPDR
jgi:hypothetical protein